MPDPPPAVKPDFGGAAHCNRRYGRLAICATLNRYSLERLRYVTHAFQPTDGGTFMMRRAHCDQFLLGPARRQWLNRAMTDSEIWSAATPDIYPVQTRARGPSGSLPLTEEMLLDRPSGDIFGLTQNAGMGWDPRELGRKQFLILSTQGGPSAIGRPSGALGYHTGPWENGLLAQVAAGEF